MDNEEQLRQAAQAFRDAPEIANKAAALALNTAARNGRTLGGRKIREQVNLKAAYVNKHLKVRAKATPTSLETRISATKRGTLLTRYGAEIRMVRAPSAQIDSHNLDGDPARGIPWQMKAAGTKNVKIKRRGAAKVLKHAFWVPLQGSGQWAPVQRTGDGRGDYEVLYGPSVSQVWTDVREQVEPEIAAFTLSEFSRQFARLA